MPHSWCKFCEEHHKKSTCEVRNNHRDKIFGKIPETTTVGLDVAKLEDVLIITTRNKSYAPKGKYDPPRNSYSSRSSSPTTMVKFPKVPDNQGTTSHLSSSKYNITLLHMGILFQKTFPRFHYFHLFF